MLQESSDDLPEKIEKTETLNLYPNPVSDILFYEVESKEENITLQITNNLGQVILNKPVNSGQNSLNVAAFTSGIYLVQVKEKSGIIIDQKKIIVE